MPWGDLGDPITFGVPSLGHEFVTGSDNLSVGLITQSCLETSARIPRRSWLSSWPGLGSGLDMEPQESLVACLVLHLDVGDTVCGRR